MLTARGLIEAARDRHPAFTPERHPNRVLVRQLSGEHRRLVGKVAIENPSAIAAKLGLPLDGYDFEAGVEMPAHSRIHGAEAHAKSGGLLPLCSVAWENRFDVIPQVPSYYVHGGHFFLKGHPSRWRDFERVEVSYLPTPGELDGLDAPLVLPDSAEAALVSYLALTMAGRASAGGADGTRFDLSLLAAERSASEADFLREIKSQRRARVFRVHQVR